MSKVERINELLQTELAIIISREAILKDALLTISYVRCSEDLKDAHVGFSVLPDKLAGTALRSLKSHTHIIVANLKKRIKLRRLPKITWEFDATERKADELEKIIKEANS